MHGSESLSEERHGEKISKRKVIKFRNLHPFNSKHEKKAAWIRRERATKDWNKWRGGSQKGRDKHRGIIINCLLSVKKKARPLKQTKETMGGSGQKGKFS